MTSYDKLRRRCVQALDPSHVDAGGQPFPYAMVSAAEVLALLDKVAAVEALADEWQRDHDSGGNGRHGYHATEYADYFAEDLRGALGDV
jgi:hypothetical protein